MGLSEMPEMGLRYRAFNWIETWPQSVHTFCGLLQLQVRFGLLLLETVIPAQRANNLDFRNLIFVMNDNFILKYIIARVRMKTSQKLDL